MGIQTQPNSNQFPETPPENRLDIPPDMQSVPFYRAYRMAGGYQQLLESHFSDVENVTDSVIRNKLLNKPFTQDDQTGILIRSANDWDPTREETRPAVLWRRADVDVARLVIGDLAAVDATTGKYTFLTQLGGVHIFFAVARTSDEADRLAFEVARVLTVSIPIVRDQFDLQRLQVVKVGEAALVEESKNHYAAPIVMVYKLDDNYSVQPHVPVLKRVTATL